MSEDKIKILFVCSGNICRSPLAHKLFIKLAIEKKCDFKFEIDSCGTGVWHDGENTDRRMRELVTSKGWSLNKKARKITEKDMQYFDHILVMDKGHIHQVKNMFKNDTLFSKVVLFRKYDEQATKEDMEVPDPYYGGVQGFEDVYNMVERTCIKLIYDLKQKID